MAWNGFWFLVATLVVLWLSFAVILARRIINVCLGSLAVVLLGILRRHLVEPRSLLLESRLTLELWTLARSESWLSEVFYRLLFGDGLRHRDVPCWLLGQDRRVQALTLVSRRHLLLVHRLDLGRLVMLRRNPLLELAWIVWLADTHLVDVVLLRTKLRLRFLLTLWRHHLVGLARLSLKRLLNWLFVYIRLTRITGHRNIFILPKAHSWIRMVRLLHRNIMLSTILRLLSVKLRFMHALAHLLMTILLVRISLLRLMVNIFLLALGILRIDISLRLQVLRIEMLLVTIFSIAFTVAVSVTVGAAMTISIAIRATVPVSVTISIRTRVSVSISVSIAGGMTVSVTIVIVTFEIFVELVFSEVSYNTQKRRVPELCLKQFNFLLDQLILDVHDVGARTRDDFDAFLVGIDTVVDALDTAFKLHLQRAPRKSDHK